MFDCLRLECRREKLRKRRMGCNESKIENEEAVSRCKDRKLFMKDAVTARNAFAAAHSSYATYLKNTGAALSDYAHGEVAHQYLRHSASSPHLASSSTSPPHPQQSSLPSSSATSSAAFAEPPPPPSFIDMPPLQRAVSMPEMKIQKPDPVKQGTIIEEEEGEDETDSDDEPRSQLKRRSSRNRKSAVENEGDPPPPPPMEERETRHVPMMPQQHDTTYDFFFGGVENVPATGLSETMPPPVAVEGVRVKNEESERKVSDEKPKRVVESEKVEVAVVEPVGKNLKRVVKQQSSGAEGKRVVKMSFNLLQICVQLDDQFLKASESAHEVSKMLEATRLHYHSNFADNRGNELELFDGLKGFLLTY